MSVCFTIRGIQEAQKEVDYMGNDFKKIASQVHSTFESTRQKQFAEINVCNAQNAQINAELTQAQQAIDHNQQVKTAAEHKVAQLEVMLQKYQSQLASTKSQLSSLQSQLASLSPPSSTGNDEADKAARQSYEAQKAALQSAISAARQQIAELEKKIAEIKAEITRLKAIIVKVSQNNTQLAKVKEQLYSTKRAVTTHLSKLKESKSKLYEKHDSFNTYYGYAQSSINNTYSRIGQALSHASMAVSALGKLGSSSDAVEMDEGTLLEGARMLEAHIHNMESQVEELMRRKDDFRRKLKDKISDRVKQDMERIDQAALQIRLNLNDISRTLEEAYRYLSSYSFLGK